MQLDLRTLSCLACTGALLAFSAPLSAGEKKLTTTTSATCIAPTFGWSVALSGLSTTADRLLVGSPGYDDAAGYVDRGAIYFYAQAGGVWTEGARFLLQGGSEVPTFDGAQFGYAVTLWGDQACAGAPYLHHQHIGNPELPDAGATLTLRKDESGLWVSGEQFYGWSAYGDFGFAVALQSTVLAEAAPTTPADPSHMGLVRTRALVGGSWWDDGELIAPDSGGGFARSVSAWVNRVAVGAPSDSHLHPSAGAVYLYRNVGGTWTYEQKLTASDAATDDAFGYAVAMAGNYLAIGAPGKDSGRGRVYVFHLSSGVWTQVANLSAGDGAATDSLGISVASWDPYLVAGASGDDDNGANGGAVYGFQRLAGGYAEVGKRNAGDGLPGDEYGTSVAIYNSSFAVGSPYSTVGGKAAAGAVYVYDWADLAGHLFSDSFERGTVGRWSAHFP